MTSSTLFEEQIAHTRGTEQAGLQRIASLAQLSTGSESALICVFDEVRAGAGLYEDLSEEELEQVLTLCSGSNALDSLLVIADVQQAIRDKTGARRTGPNYLGSLVAAPIVVSQVRIGALVVISETGRSPDSFEQKILLDLARLAADKIELTRSLRHAQLKHFRAQQIFQEVSDGVITVNEFGHIRRINRAAERIFGYEGSGLRGERIVLSADDGLILAPANDEATKMPPDFAGFLGTQHTIASRNARGRALTLEMTVAEVMLHDEHGYVLTVRDVTELNEIQLLLKQHAFIVEHTESAVLVTDADNRIEWCNAGFEATSGYTKQQIRGRDPLELLWASDNDPAVIEQVQQAIARKESYKTEMMWRRSNGQPFWVAVEAHPICNISGELVKYIALGFDITERKRSAKMKTDFVSMVSHELRTPLTVIAGTLEAMLDGIAGPMPDLAEELLVMGKRNCTSLATLIDDLLDVNQLESGVVKLNSREFNIDQVLSEVVESMGTLAEENGLKLNLTPNDQAARVFSDPERLNQVLTNLVGNALKFSPVDTAVTVGYQIADNRVRVNVADQGTGISHDFRPKLFQMFSRDPAVEASGKEGFGLGLCISKGLMDRMGGEIGFDCPPEGGSVFYFELPLLRENPPANSAGSESQSDSLLSFSPEESPSHNDNHDPAPGKKKESASAVPVTSLEVSQVEF